MIPASQKETNQREKDLGLLVRLDAPPGQHLYQHQLDSPACEEGLDFFFRLGGVLSPGIQQDGDLRDVGKAHQRGGNLAFQPAQGCIYQEISH